MRVAVFGIPAALLIGLLGGMVAGSEQPDNLHIAALVASVAVLVPVLISLTLAWLGRTARPQLAILAGVVCVLMAAAAGAVAASMNGSPGKGTGATVVNDSDGRIEVVTNGSPPRVWVTLDPGETARADPPFLSLNGCYSQLQLTARTTDGRVLEESGPVCNNRVWRITDPGSP